MRLSQLSTVTQDGLRKWAAFQHADELLFDDNASSPEFWAWICFQLRAAEDKPDWFPRGKWATIQLIEEILGEQAKAERRA